jgi:carboxylesterase
MAQQGNYRGREPLVTGKEDAPRTVILFHGYTGSTGDFGDLPERIADALDARVVVPLLPGHGTCVEDLLTLDFQTFVDAAVADVACVAATGKPFAIGGHSFGAYLAVLAASQFTPVALFTSVIPYHLRFPYSWSIGRLISRSKTLWTKQLPQDEWEARRGFFFYRQMPGIGLSLVHEGNRRIVKIIPSITYPLLAIHAANDNLAHPESAALSIARVPHERKESFVLENGRHSIFISDSERQNPSSKILDFLGRSFAQHSHGV